MNHTNNENMEQIINTLLHADAAAQETLRENQQRRQQMADSMAKAREDLQRDLGDKAQARIEQVRALHEGDLEKEKKHMEQEYDETLAALQKSFDAHREEWIDTLVKRCLT